MIANEDFVVVVRQMDSDFSLHYPSSAGGEILPSGQWCGAAKSIKADVRLHTGWHDTELACREELERLIG